VRRARPNGRQAANLVAKGRTSKNGWKGVGTIHVRGRIQDRVGERLSLSSNDVERPLAEPTMLYEVRDFSGFLLLFFFFFVFCFLVNLGCSWRLWVWYWLWLWVSEGFVEYGVDEKIWKGVKRRGGEAVSESEVCE
jgi:hypothetical protein